MSDASLLVERIGAEGIKVVDFRFTDLAGRWRHVGREAGGVTAELLAGRRADRRLGDPGLARHHRIRSAAPARPRQRVRRPVHRPADAGAVLRRGRARHRPRLRARSALGRAARRGLPAPLRVMPTRSGSRPGSASSCSTRSRSSSVRCAAGYQLTGSEHRTGSARAARDGHRPNPDAAYLSLPPGRPHGRHPRRDHLGAGDAGLRRPEAGAWPRQRPERALLRAGRRSPAPPTGSRP